MTVGCEWIENNLEALSNDSLNEEESRLAHTHMESCGSCRNEVQALKAIDPLVKTFFQRELRIARRPRAVATRRVFGLSGAAAAFVAILLFIVFRVPQPTTLTPGTPTPPQIAPIAEATPPAPIKNNDAAGEVARTKPSAEPSAPANRSTQAAPVVPENTQELLITDPAGYSHTLDEYRGHVVVLGVWGADQSEAAANLDRLYKTYGANPKFRFLGVSNQRIAKPANTTFPVFYNQGSKIFGAQLGDFVLLDENGRIEQRGSLVKDISGLQKALQGK